MGLADPTTVIASHAVSHDASLVLSCRPVSLVNLSHVRSARHSKEFRMFCDDGKYLPVHEAETFMDERPMRAVREVESVNLVHDLLD